MGRPLKIAKAQAVITITATDGTTEVVTTSNNFTTLGIIAGMSFVPATNVGNLVAGTTYWILRVVTSGNNSTFTVSATQLSANPTYTPFNLAAAGPVTVNCTVNPVDTYFNNPAGSANTYSVVGGNTAFYGNQVSCVVAIGISGAGVIVSDSGNANIFGGGTDFANTLSAGTAIQAVTSTGATVNLGFASTVNGYTTIPITSTAATGSFVVTSGNAQTFTVDKPVTFTGNLGGLTTSDVYYVKSIANTTHFTVTLNPGGAPVPVTTASGSVNARQDRVTLAANASNTFVTGVNYVYANDEAGFIVRQKGKQKYLVRGTTTGLTSQCYTANLANAALTPNTMSITATYANADTVRVQSLSDHTLELFTATSGPIATGNIVLQNASPAFATFNTAYAANTYGSQPYPIVTIASS